MLKKRVVLFRQSFTASLVFGMIASQSGAVWAEEAIQFNTDVLDVQDRGHIDLSQFSQAGYVMPGTYALAIQVNKSTLPEQQIQFLAPDNDPKGSRACLTTDLVTRLGLTMQPARNYSGGITVSALIRHHYPVCRFAEILGQVFCTLVSRRLISNMWLKTGIHRHAGMKAFRGCSLITT